jgi:sulfite exporter TauE/SafE
VSSRVDHIVVHDIAMIIGFALILAVLIAIHRSTMMLIAQLLEEIDHRVAEAIKAVVQDLQIEGIEPPNPVQQLLMGFVADKMNAAKTPRDLKGQFTPVIEMNQDSS